MDCSLGCARIATRRGLCGPCYDFKRRHGHVLPSLLVMPSEMERFAENVMVADQPHPILKTHCMLWVGATDRYGLMWVRGRPHKAHRVAWTLKRGAIPKGKHVLHHCDNPPCVNDEHLFLGNHRINMEDAAQKGRIARGERHPKSKSTEILITQLRKARTEGCSNSQISGTFNVPEGTLGNILCGRSWAHLLRKD